MKRSVMMSNKKQPALVIATCFFAALPVICLPVSFGIGMSPGTIVAQANEALFGVTYAGNEEVVIEEWALKSEQGTDVTNPTEYTEVCAPVSYTDIPKFVVYQRYDDSDLPIELLDPQCFAADDTIFYVRADRSILKELPNMDSVTIVSLHLGQQVTRTGIGDTWSRIRTENGDEGYVLTDSIQDTMLTIEIDRTVWVDTDSLAVRAEPSSSSDQVTVVNEDDKLICSAIVGDKWYKVKTTGGQTGYVYISYTTTTPPPTPTPTPTPRPRSSSSSGGSSGGSRSNGGSRSSPTISGCNGESIVSIAESMLGVTYKMGGLSSSGIDCSGLVKYCYAQVGITDVPHGATSIYRQSGVLVSRSEIQPGDVICYDGGGGICSHCAIYVGGGQVIHASSTRGYVCYGNADMMTIKGIKRIIP